MLIVIGGYPSHKGKKDESMSENAATNVATDKPLLAVTSYLPEEIILAAEGLYRMIDQQYQGLAPQMLIDLASLLVLHIDDLEVEQYRDGVAKAQGAEADLPAVPEDVMVKLRATYTDLGEKVR